MRRTPRVVALICVTLTLVGASECGSGKSDTKDVPVTSAPVDADAERCATFRTALEESRAPKGDARLTPWQQSRKMYKRQQELYTTLARIFPSASEAARALSVIYGKAADDKLTATDEAKIAGYDNKIGDALDKYCPNSGYPAS